MVQAEVAWWCGPVICRAAALCHGVAMADQQCVLVGQGIRPEHTLE